VIKNYKNYDFPLWGHTVWPRCDLAHILGEFVQQSKLFGEDADSGNGHNRRSESTR